MSLLPSDFCWVRTTSFGLGKLDLPRLVIRLNRLLGPISLAFRTAGCLQILEQLLEFAAIQILGRLPFKRGKRGVLVPVTYLPPSRRVWHGPLRLSVLEEPSHLYRLIPLLAP